MSIPAPAPSRSLEAASVVGYVEAVTEAAALGWVWRPGHAERLLVELRVDGEVLSKAVADEGREDLAQNGIGDGRHAFSLSIGAHSRERLRNLQVFAIAKDIPATPLEFMAAAGGKPDSQVQLQRSVDMLIASQRMLHRNLQAALTKSTPAADAVLTEISAAQSRLQESTSIIEIHAARLEQALTTRETRGARASTSRALAAAVVLATCALIASSVALGRVLLGG